MKNSQQTHEKLFRPVIASVISAFIICIPNAAQAEFAAYTSEAAWLSSVTSPTLIDFDNLADGTAVSSQYPGVSFSPFNGGIPLAAAESFPFSLPNLLSVDNPSLGGAGGVAIGFASPQTGMGFRYNDAQFAGNTVTVYGTSNQILGTFELVYPHPVEWQFVGFRSSGNDIARVEIALADTDRVTLDNVQFSSPAFEAPIPIAGTGAAVPDASGVFTAFPQSPALSLGSAAFLGTGSAGSFGVYLYDSAIPTDPIRPIADLATPIPGGTGLFTGFTDLALAALPQDPIRVAFLGQGAGQAGAYLFDSALPVDAIRTIADLSTLIPAGSGSFTGFTAVSVSPEHTAFLGLGSSGQKGIYLASTLSKVIAVGDRLADKTVTDLRFGRDGLSGIHLAFTAHFADGSEGVFSAQVAAYPFQGFFAPVDNLPVFNKAKAGAAIPVKFSLGGNQGLTIFAPGFPKSQPIACDAAVSVDGIEETVTAGKSSLAYAADTDQYSYVWKTEKAWANTCRQWLLQLNDGTQHSANFNFRIK